MSRMDDEINRIGVDQALQAVLDFAEQVAAYYLALRRHGVPTAAAAGLAAAFQASWLARVPASTPPPETGDEQ